ncbi:hypothetical protein HRG84_24095 [Flavisolibacter sp. BT320]|nr:hypothetical protein [Flavisolibacter longurius]
MQVVFECKQVLKTPTPQGVRKKGAKIKTEKGRLAEKKTSGNAGKLEKTRKSAGYMQRSILILVISREN